MKRTNKRELYESLMSKIAKEVKHAINEAYDEDEPYYDADYNSENSLDDLKKLPSKTKRITVKTIKPRTKNELKAIINDTIAKKGYRCDLNFIDTSLITDMSYLFCDSKFNGDISQWDVHMVVDMEGMFRRSKFDGDISDWDVSSVENMRLMFAEAKFDGDISRWNVSNVRCVWGLIGDNPDGPDVEGWYLPRLKDPDTTVMYEETAGRW